MKPHAWRQHLLAGLLATAALVGLMLLLSYVTALSFVPLDVADAIIHLTPGAIATRGIESLGPLAKLMIELTGALIVIAAGGAAAVIYGRRGPRPLALAGLALALLAAALTVVAQLAAGGLRGGPIGLGLTGLLYLGWGYGLAWMLNRLAAPAATDSGRRTFLLQSGGTLLAVAVGSTALAELVRRSGAATPSVAGAGQALPTSPPAPTATSAPTVAPSATPAPTALASAAEASATSAPTSAPAPTPAPSATPAPAFAPASNLRGRYNDNTSLYVISSGTRDPEVARESWRLSVGGAVDSPFSLAYDELVATARVDQTSTLECISNEVGNYLIGNVKWNGVRLRDLLERAGVQDGVIDIKLTAADGYTESVPLARAMDPTGLIAYGIDGQALAVKHGFPARLIVPGLYGEKNVKWLTKIEAVREDYQGYWQQRGWTDDATIHTTSVIDNGNSFLGPQPPLTRENGVVAVGGIAFAGNRGISKVEIQVDGGDWQPATLDPMSDPLTWRFWRYDWAAAPGKHTLSVRAVDGEGNPQIMQPRPPHPDGATGYHSVTVEVV